MNLELPSSNSAADARALREVAAAETVSWAEANNRYLSVSLHWLRLRLQHAALASTGSDPAGGAGARAERHSDAQVDASARERPRWFAGAGTPASRVASAPLAGPAAVASLAAALADAATERARHAQSDTPPALPLLAARLGLSPFEADIVLLCVAMELDPSIPTLIAAAEGGRGHGHPSFALALQLFEQASWDALAPQRPLRYLRLLEINQPGATPLTSAALRADERIVNFVKGLNLLDDRFAGLLTRVEHLAPISDTQQQRVEALLAMLHGIDGASELPVLQLLGHDPGSRRAIAAHAAAALGRSLYVLPLQSLPAPRAEIETLARLWQRESFLLPVALYIDADAADGANADNHAALRCLLGQSLGLTFLGLRGAPLQLDATRWSVEAAMPTADEQHAAWRDVLPEDLPQDERERECEALSGHFRLNLEQIGTAARTARARHSEAWDECRDLCLPQLDALAQRLDPKARWDDLVMAEEASSLLRQIAGQVHERHRVYQQWGYGQRMNRGMGISALFAGESGTGKTMAAEVIANELRMHLYRIDLSSVVSKYIGETEKNLRRLFDAAEQGGVILLFDEADALFGKRSEVKDSHDRYANIEINYLLQRMEAFSGLAILATNMKSALDTAFMRRLRFVVNFQFPGPAERARIWRSAFAGGVPLDCLDYDRLARFGLSGGNIHSIALNAAFAAAHAGTAVGMPLLLATIRAELRKLEKPINEAEFR